MAEIYHFLCLDDNFGVLMHDKKTGATVAIDAPDARPILAALAAKNWTLTHILITHGHWDHTQGIEGLRAQFDVEVMGPNQGNTELYDTTLGDGDTFSIGSLKGKAITTPGHTLDMTVYWFEEEKVVFTGDTLLSLGCGRVFEGSMAMMWQSLLKIRALPDETKVYCGHEYTLSNGQFAISLDTENTALKQRLDEVKRLRSMDEFTLPVLLGDEKAQNPFLRADDAALQEALGMQGSAPEDVFTALRLRKDRF